MTNDGKNRMKSKSRVIHLTEAGTGIGFGHLFRQISLAHEIEKRGFDVEFVVHGDFQGEIPFRSKFFDRWEKAEIEDFVSGDDIVVIDSYIADYDIYELVSKTAAKAIFFDDFLRFNYPPSYVVNGCIGAENLNYPDGCEVNYLLGVSYQLLRPEFSDLRRKQPTEVKRIMVTFGGDDMRNMTPKIVKMIRKIAPKLEVHVVVGSAFTNRDEIGHLIAENVTLHHSLDAEGMRNLMEKCDLAVTAAGQTLYELGSVGTPAIMVGIAENQRKNIEGWSESGIMKSAGFWNESDFCGRFENLLKKSIDGKFFVENSSFTFPDSNGAKRIVDAVTGVKNG